MKLEYLKFMALQGKLRKNFYVFTKCSHQVVEREQGFEIETVASRGKRESLKKKSTLFESEHLLITFGPRVGLPSLVYNQGAPTGVPSETFSFSPFSYP